MFEVVLCMVYTSIMSVVVLCGSHNLACPPDRRTDYYGLDSMERERY